MLSKHFQKKGILVNFLPKPNDGVGSGAHVHLSLWKDGESASGDKDAPYAISGVFNSFLAGLLKYFPALAHFLAPSHNSTRRLLPGYFAGNYVFWGIDNKEAPIRVVAPSKPKFEVTNAEIKTFDHTANHYVAFALTIVCGIAGIKEGLKLPTPCQEDPGNWTEEKRLAEGLKEIPNTFA